MREIVISRMDFPPHQIKSVLRAGFIAFEGGDGCGKSTQQQRLGERLCQIGQSVVYCRDPGSTSLGNEVRRILLHGKELNITDRTESFLFMAARTQLIDEVIRPALAAGKTVLSDRFLLSTFVYQGCAGGVSSHVLETLGQIAVDKIVPDLTIILDIPYQVALQRIGRRACPDRMEAKGEDYHRRVREGFLKYAEQAPDRIAVFDGTQSPEELETAIFDRVIQGLRFRSK